MEALFCYHSDIKVLTRYENHKAGKQVVFNSIKSIIAAPMTSFTSKYT